MNPDTWDDVTVYFLRVGVTAFLLCAGIALILWAGR